MVTAAGEGKRRLTVLGSTGSIGVNTLEAAQWLGGRDAFDMVALTGGSNVTLLAEQARLWRPKVAAIRDPNLLTPLRDALAGTGVEAMAGDGAISEAASRPADVCVAAIVGAAGMRPTLAAAAAGADIALANKECLVCGGAAFLRETRKAGAAVIPVDSEHSAIFQCLMGSGRAEAARLVLTASGGPFRDWPLEKMRAVTPEQAVAHPNWSMGAKISVDSATMFNKGLELIEAAHLFDAPSERIDVVVHPQSIVHSMVTFRDGAVMAQMGAPDMRGPIVFALSETRRPTTPIEPLDLTAVGRLDFFAPDPVRFPALRLSRAALEAGGLAPCALNGAKEVALEAFLQRRLGFLQIADVVEEILAVGDWSGADHSIDDAFAADAESRRLAAVALARAA